MGKNKKEEPGILEYSIILILVAALVILLIGGIGGGLVGIVTSRLGFELSFLEQALLFLAGSWAFNYVRKNRKNTKE
jgi:hypothetical protein